jgi:muramoyltetrapeptide carboxypeptidase
MNMIIPPYLKAGDTIGIAATARKVKPHDIEKGIQFLENNGFKVVLCSNIYDEYFQFAGNDESRTKGLQELLDHSEIKAIICARGGYGTVKIIDQLDFELFKANPKWLIGFSDVTVLHARIHTLEIGSIHGPMLVNLNEENPSSGLYISSDSKNELIATLKGVSKEFSVHRHPLNSSVEKINGRIFGGNLSVFYSLSGSVDGEIPENCILILEDIDEYIYHFDRMIQWLQRSMQLSKLKGIVVGHLTKMKNLDENNPFGLTAEEILKSSADLHHIPIMFGLPFGHESENYSFILGKEYTFTQHINNVSISDNQV